MLLKSISCVKIKLFCVLTGQRLSDIIEKLSNNWFPPTLRCGENKEFETDCPSGALLNSRIGCNKFK